MTFNLMHSYTEKKRTDLKPLYISVAIAIISINILFINN